MAQNFCEIYLKHVCWCVTCPVVQIEDGTLVPDATHLADRGNTGVLGIILRTEVLQLQDLGFPLQHVVNIMRGNLTFFAQQILYTHSDSNMFLINTIYYNIICVFLILSYMIAYCCHLEVRLTTFLSKKGVWFVVGGKRGLKVMDAWVRVVVRRQEVELACVKKGS